MIDNVKDENQNFKICQKFIYMICSVKPLNYNLENEKVTTQFVVSASYLNTDQQRIQENNACTKVIWLNFQHHSQNYLGSNFLQRPICKITQMKSIVSIIIYLHSGLKDFPQYF